MKRRFAFFICMSLTASMMLTGCQNISTKTSDSDMNSSNTEDAGAGEDSSVTDMSDLSKYKDARVLELNETTATLDGNELENFDYSWHTDPSKEKPWYEGDEPQTEAAAYIAHDIWYYPVQDESNFTQKNYDGENEWVSYYTADGLKDYIYSTLPVQGDEVPTEMMHTADEAYENQVLHITKAGTYVLQGSWHGQILVDLGEKDDTFTDKEAKVTLVMNGVEVTCDCAPAFLAYSAYECDNSWEEKEEYTNSVDLSDAGVNVLLADNSINSFTGSNIFRLLKAEYKKEGSDVQKKLLKIDGTFYSYVSMKIDSEEKGTGILNITSGFEGLDDELHLTINGGNINIYSQNDGINVNEDKVSVFTMNGGTLHVFAGLGFEGDGIDSNGYIVINDGLIAGGTPSGADEILDSDCGNTINGGEVITIGSTGGPGRFGWGQTPPEGLDGERPELPEGQTPPERMTPPEGFGGERPELPTEPEQSENQTKL